MSDRTASIQLELVVVRCQLGERRAFDELVALWHIPLWRYLRRILGRDDLAEDALQETWLRALRSLPRLRQPERFAPWFYSIARHVVMDRLREKYQPANVGDVDIDEVVDTALPALEEEELRTLRAGLAALPLIEREVLTLFYLQELTIRDVAEVTGVPEGTVKSRLHRAKRMLTDLLVKE